MRSAAQMVAYEIAMGFALVGVLMATGSMNLGTIVRTQEGGLLSWKLVLAVPAADGVFHLRDRGNQPRAIRRRRRRIRDRCGLSRRVLRHRVRAVLPGRIRQHDPDLDPDSGVLLGGWQGPLQGYPGLGDTFLGQPGFLWLFLKVFCLVFLFLWFRATFPRYRYDQIMRLGWKALIPGDPGVDRRGDAVRRVPHRTLVAPWYH